MEKLMEGASLQWQRLILGNTQTLCSGLGAEHWESVAVVSDEQQGQTAIQTPAWS